MQRWHLTPARYRTITAGALGVLCLIVLTGVLVRLTGSGLGCDDWPNCSSKRGKLVDVSSTHAAIEQVNRFLTGLVSVGVIAAVLGALRRVPRRRDLTLLSLGLVAGVIGQIVLGGITVLVDLHPAAVQGHFLLSMVLVADAVILHHRAALADGTRARPLPGAPVGHAFAVLAMTAITLALGTIVTGAGPHAGSEDVQRYGFAIPSAVRAHSIAVWITVAVVLALALRVRNSGQLRRSIEGPLTAWIGVALAQAAVGYVQYFSDVPAVLVFFHVLGATALWSVTVWLVASIVMPLPWAVDRSADQTLDERGALVDHG